MDRGVWLDIGAVVIAGGALVVALMAWWQAKRSADAAFASAHTADRLVALEAERFEAEHPGVAFEFSHTGMLFRVHNVGRYAAEHVQVLNTDRDVLLEVGRLEPQAVSAEFRVPGTWQSGTIEYLLVDCDGLEGPLAVRISDPPRPPKPSSPPRRIR